MMMDSMSLLLSLIGATLQSWSLCVQLRDRQRVQTLVSTVFKEHIPHALSDALQEVLENHQVVLHFLTDNRGLFLDVLSDFSPDLDLEGLWNQWSAWEGSTVTLEMDVFIRILESVKTAYLKNLKVRIEGVNEPLHQGIASRAHSDLRFDKLDGRLDSFADFMQTRTEQTSTPLSGLSSELEAASNGARNALNAGKSDGAKKHTATLTSLLKAGADSLPETDKKRWEARKHYYEGEYCVRFESDLNKALGHYSRALDLDPSSKYSHRVIEVFALLRRFKDAANALEEHARLWPDDEIIPIARVQLAYIQGDSTTALATLEPLIKDGRIQAIEGLDVGRLHRLYVNLLYNEHRYDDVLDQREPLTALGLKMDALLFSILSMVAKIGERGTDGKAVPTANERDDVENLWNTFMTTLRENVMDRERIDLLFQEAVDLALVLNKPEDAMFIAEQIPSHILVPEERKRLQAVLKYNIEGVSAFPTIEALLGDPGKHPDLHLTALDHYLKYKELHVADSKLREWEKELSSLRDDRLKLFKAELAYALAADHRDEKSLSRATELYEQSELDPTESILAMAVECEIKHAHGNTEEALTLLTRSYERFHHSPDYHLFVRSFHDSLGDFSTASESYWQAYELTSSPQLGLEVVRFCLHRGLHTRALDYAKKVASDFPDSHAVATNLAICYTEVWQPQETLDALESIPFGKMSREAFQARTLAELDLLRFEDAMNTASAAAARFPDEPEAHMLRFRVHSLLGELESAFSCICSALELRPDDPFLISTVAFLSVLLGKREEKYIPPLREIAAPSIGQMTADMPVATAGLEEVIALCRNRSEHCNVVRQNYLTEDAPLAALASVHGFPFVICYQLACTNRMNIHYGVDIARDFEIELAEEGSGLLVSYFGLLVLDDLGVLENAIETFGDFCVDVGSLRFLQIDLAALGSFVQPHRVSQMERCLRTCVSSDSLADYGEAKKYPDALLMEMQADSARFIVFDHLPDDFRDGLAASGKTLITLADLMSSLVTNGAVSTAQAETVRAILGTTSAESGQTVIPPSSAVLLGVAEVLILAETDTLEAARGHYELHLPFQEQAHMLTEIQKRDFQTAAQRRLMKLADLLVRSGTRVVTITPTDAEALADKSSAVALSLVPILASLTNNLLIFDPETWPQVQQIIHKHGGKRISLSGLLEYMKRCGKLSEDKHQAALRRVANLNYCQNGLPVSQRFSP